MTVAEAIAIRESEEIRCRTCTRYVCRACTECWHNSNFVRTVPIREKILDREIDNYR